MLRNGDVDKVAWHFYPGKNGTFGPDEALLDEFIRLQKAGYNISFKLWIP